MTGERRRPTSGRNARIEALERRQLLSFALDRDVGAPALPGSTAFAKGVYTVAGAGADIGGTTDQFHFSSDPLRGDGSIVARVASFSAADAGAKAGVMLRNGDAATAAFAGLFVTGASTVSFVVRSADGATAGQSISPGVSAPRFLRLSRSGALVSAAYSSDAIVWFAVGSPLSTALGSAGASVGLAVTSRDPARLATATFSDVSLLLPSGWNEIDVGTASLGSARYDVADNAFAVGGRGTGIGNGSADAFDFVYRAQTGDASVVTRVDALSAADPAADAGAMVRDGVSPGAPFAAVVRSASATPQVTFRWRTTAGTAASAVSVAAPPGPLWLKLEDAADTFSASYSIDRATWAPIGVPQRVTLSSATAWAGLAVASHDASAFATATFSGTSVVESGWDTGDVGASPIPAAAAHDPPSDTYTLVGRGAGVAGTSDAFAFVRRTLRGDGSVVAHVNSISAGAAAGVMIRADAAPDSPFAAAFVDAVLGVVFAFRTSQGAALQQVTNVLPTGPITTPLSLRVTRVGDRFSASYSTDGTLWTLVGPSRTIAMPTNAFGGLAVSAGGSTAVARFSAAGVGASLPPGAGVYSADDGLFLDDLQRRSVQFYWLETNPSTGMVPDGANANGGGASAASSIAATGFGLTALTIGDRRGWIAHADAYQRALNTVNFLNSAAANVHGFFYHFLSPTTGQRVGTSEVSPIDTALLMAGVLNVAEHWPDTPLHAAATSLFNRVEWPWMLKPDGQYYGHWTPEGGFAFGYGDFSEAALLYLMGLGSPTHPAPRSTWTAWSRTPVVTYGGHRFVTAQQRALFTVQYPQAWFDLRGLTDSTGLDFYANAGAATLAQRQLGIDLAGTFAHYGPNLWGWTASDSAAGYQVFGGPPATSNVDGIVVPTAPGGSLAFTPRQSLDALRTIRQVYGNPVYRKYGFVDAFNPRTNWTSSIVLGIDVGMMLVAAENARSSFVWDTFRRSAAARQSLAAAYPSLVPSLMAASSRKASTGGAAPDVPVLSLPGDDGPPIESREGGLTQLVLTFDAAIVKGPGFAVTATGAGGGAAVLSSVTSGSTLTITLGANDVPQVLSVSVSDVRHDASSAPASFVVEVGVLGGDATRDGRVDFSDLLTLAQGYGSAATGPDQGDFTFDGTVGFADLLLLAQHYGDAFRAGATAVPATDAPRSAAGSGDPPAARDMTVARDAPRGPVRDASAAAINDSRPDSRRSRRGESVADELLGGTPATLAARCEHRAPERVASTPRRRWPTSGCRR